MKIDSQTIRNLDIFPFSDNHEKRPCIFDIFNRTMTEGGAGKLKFLFKNGHDNLSGIFETRDSLKYILSHYDTWSVFEDLLLDTPFPAINSYLSLSLNTIDTGRSFFSHFKAFRWKRSLGGYSARVADNSRTAAKFIKELSKCTAEIDTDNIPTKLENIITSLRFFIRKKEVRKLLELSRKRYLSSLSLSKTDKIIRTDLAKDIRDIFDFLYELDSLFSVALSVYDNNFYFPEFIESSKPVVEIENLYHPLVENCVPNDFRLDRETNLLFLTGPNMAGKSTYIKSIAICVYLAHLGLGVPAKNMKLTQFNRLIASMATTDDITSGCSYFYNEVRRVKEIGEALDDDSFQLVIMDEPFKGTNIKDAFDAGERLLKLLTKRRSALFLFSTHIAELGDTLESDTVTPGYFRAEENITSFTYDYKLRRGISSQKLGVKIMEQEKVFDLFGG